MGKILLAAPPKKIFLTATDKRNRFSCLMPIFIEQLDNHLDIKISENSLNSEIIILISEMIECLKRVFEKASMGLEFSSDNPTFQELIDYLRFYKDGPILIAGPEALTYINFRLEKLIRLFD
ncbi:MAG TPA: hypothetical protein DDY52_01515 [Candidatus Moranbacteria bacterium]|nr:MAG: hypothetical protein UR51_C0010G0031 [Candidatus Moranbacteria bacterium GW2011_GWF1_34_10]HBI16821.1 hypothetical protein [Candidatus Moranbacteria bacterium]